MIHSDPLGHANILAQFGRTKEAAETLREAIRRSPSHSELRIRLEELLTMKHTVPWRDRVRIGFHLTMAWVLLIGSSAVVFGFPVVLINAFQTDLESLAAFWGMIWFLSGLLTSIAVLAIAWSYLFLVLWFTYLKSLRHDVRRIVDEGLPSALNAFLFEPIYGRVRRRFFFDNGA